MNDDYITNFIYRPPQEDGVTAEFGSNQPIRFLIKSDEDEKYVKCLDCLAQMHIRDLEEINDETDLFVCSTKIKDALLFVLENIDWPVGE